VRVLLCVPAYAPADDYGGPVTKVRLLARGLANRGVAVEILTADFGFGRTRVPTGRRLVDGIPVTYLRRLVARGHLSVSVGVKEYMRGQQFDVVHSFGLRDGMVSETTRRALAAGIPVVVEPMGMTPARVRSFRLKGVFDRALGDRLTGRAVVTIATSKLEDEQLRVAGFPNVQIRYNPVEFPPVSRPDDAPRSYDICYVGRLHRVKRVPDILAAVEALPAKTAVIAGPDEDGSGADLRAEAVARGITDRVTFRGWVDPAERLRLLWASRCFALPSITENFGSAAAEAMAAGVPVVVTRECGIAPLVEMSGAGAVVDVGPAGLTDGVTKVLQLDPHTAGAAARLAVVPLAPDSVAAAQRVIYESAIAGGR